MKPVQTMRLELTEEMRDFGYRVVDAAVAFETQDRKQLVAGGSVTKMEGTVAKHYNDIFVN